MAREGKKDGRVELIPRLSFLRSFVTPVTPRSSKCNRRILSSFHSFFLGSRRGAECLAACPPAIRSPFFQFHVVPFLRWNQLQGVSEFRIHSTDFGSVDSTGESEVYVHRTELSVVCEDRLIRLHFRIVRLGTVSSIMLVRNWRMEMICRYSKYFVLRLMQLMCNSYIIVESCGFFVYST